MEKQEESVVEIAKELETLVEPFVLACTSQAAETESILHIY